MLNKLLLLLIFINIQLFLLSQGNSFGTILGKGELNLIEITNFIKEQIPECDTSEIKRIISIYIIESYKEGINHEIAIAQMILETGYLRFRGTVKKEQNNFCGLGAISSNNRGHNFSSDTIGIKAHIQHLKAYASEELTKEEIIDPRYYLVVPKGKSPTIYGLSGTWASDLEYANKIEKIIIKMLKYRRNYSN